MIAKITRGWGIYGLVHYLMGPGQFNEHVNQHVIATWDGAPEMHQPSPVGNGWFDVSELADRLAEPADAAGIDQSLAPLRAEGARIPRGPVWHCSLRNHADDRVLSDAEWAEVVADLLHRTGIARRGDLGGCRWVAIRHADDHVHVAAVLVRQDNGRRVHPRNDRYRARDTCRAAERRLGLTETPEADRTTVAPVTRAEMEKAARRGKAEPSRSWLRRQARIAAVQARDPEEFLRRLGDLGVLVRPRELPPGQLVGYAVAEPGDVNSVGSPVWYSGRRLARDLSLPQLVSRWASASPPAEQIPPAASERSRVGRAERDAAVSEAITAVEEASDAVAGGDAVDAAGVAHAASDMLTAAAWVNRQNTPLAEELWPAMEVFDRAARTSGVGQPSRWSPVAAELRRAAWRLMAVRTMASGGTASGVTELLLALAALAAEIAAYREMTRCAAQAVAARRCADLLQETRPRAPAVRTHPAGPAGERPRRSGGQPGRAVPRPASPAGGPTPSAPDRAGRGRRRR